MGYNILHYSLDGTASSGLGRLVNDAPAKEANCKMKKIERERKPYLALFATKSIDIGEELRYDYGVKNLPWRAKTGRETTAINEIIF